MEQFESSTLIQKYYEIDKLFLWNFLILIFERYYLKKWSLTKQNLNHSNILILITDFGLDVRKFHQKNDIILAISQKIEVEVKSPKINIACEEKYEIHCELNFSFSYK